MAQTEAQLVLYGRDLHSLLGEVASDRVVMKEGSLQDRASLTAAMQGVDVVYLNAMEHATDTQAVVDAMQQAGVQRFIGASRKACATGPKPTCRRAISTANTNPPPSSKPRRSITPCCA